MLRGTDRIVALDIGASSIKMGVFANPRKAGVELVQFAVRDLDMDPSGDTEQQHLEGITAAVKDMMAELGLPAGPALISVPGQSVFSRFVKLPPASRDKIQQIVQYEAQQNVPFPIDEVVWDYQLVGSGEGEIDVMLAAIKAEIVGRITAAISMAGLKPELVDVAPMALYNIVRYSYAELPPCTLVIDIGARSTDLIFIEASRVFNRSIPVGGNAITQQLMREFDLPWETAEQLKREHAFVSFGGAYEAPASETADKVSKTVRSVMTRLHAEINRSINFYRTQQSGSQPGLILLTGGSSMISHLDAFLKEKTRIEVEYLNPFNNVPVSAAINAQDIGGQAHLMGEVVGVALRRALPCPIELNLLPQIFIAEDRFHHRQPFLLAAMFALTLVVAVWWAFFSQRATLGAQQLEHIKTRVAQLEQVEQKLVGVEGAIRQRQDEVLRLSGLPEQQTLWVRILSDLHGRIPDGMWLVKIRPWTEGAPGDGAAAPGAVPAGFVMPAPAGIVAPGAAGTAASGPKNIAALELTGVAYTDKVTLGAANQQDGLLKFRDDLRTSPFFDEKATDITSMPQPGRDDFVREFTIKAVLKKPVSL